MLCPKISSHSYCINKTSLKKPGFGNIGSYHNTISSKNLIIDNICRNLQDTDSFIDNLCRENQVVLFGELHNNTRAKGFITSKLKRFKQNGINDVGVEIDRKFQPDVDAFMSGKITGEDLDKRLYNIINPTILPKKVHFLETGCTLNFLKECKRLGMKVHCIDSKVEEHLNGAFNGQFVFIMEKDPAEKANSAYNRDEGIFNNLKEMFFDKNPGKKIVIYMGNAHIKKSPIGNDRNFSLAQHISEFLNGKTASVSLVKPNEVNKLFYYDSSKVPANRAFPTKQDGIKDFIYDCEYGQDFPQGYDYYGKHFDGMIVV